MNIALVAHDGRKKELIEWVKYNWMTLSDTDNVIYATGTTGKLVAQALTEAHLEFIEEETSSDFYVDK